jgi:hypothetical protein
MARKQTNTRIQVDLGKIGRCFLLHNQMLVCLYTRRHKRETTGDKTGVNFVSRRRVEHEVFRMQKDDE